MRTKVLSEVCCFVLIFHVEHKSLCENGRMWQSTNFGGLWYILSLEVLKVRLLEYRQLRHQDIAN